MEKSERIGLRIVTIVAMVILFLLLVGYNEGAWSYASNGAFYASSYMGMAAFAVLYLGLNAAILAAMWWLVKKFRSIK